MKITCSNIVAIALIAGIGIACQTTETNAEEQDRKTEKTLNKQPAAESELDRLEAAIEAFKSGNGKAFASHYAPDGLLVLSDGTEVRGPALEPAANKAGPTVREWALSSPRLHRNDGGAFVVGSSQTVLQPPNSEPFTINGTRLVAWSGSGKDATIQVDFNMAGQPVKPPAQISTRLESLGSAWNAHDLAATRTHFTDDAVYVLSDSRVFAGEDLNGLFGFTFKSGFSEMSYAPRAAWKAGDSAWFVASDFSFAMQSDGKRVEVSGCQVDLWKQVDGEWRIAAEVAQPAGSKACILESAQTRRRSPEAE